MVKQCSEDRVKMTEAADDELTSSHEHTKITPPNYRATVTENHL